MSKFAQKAAENECIIERHVRCVICALGRSAPESQSTLLIWWKWVCQHYQWLNFTANLMERRNVITSRC